ncbi:MAG: hypothetical protein J6B10_03075 [Lachnospiraceae bacterium]|nr:hypothetical protein [Lachnospiraceae bacterium]
MGIFEAVLATIKSKISPLFSKLRLWTKPSYIKNHLLVKIREYLNHLFNLRPEHKQDYYCFGRWMVSRKLAALLIVFTAAVSLYVIFALKPERTDQAFGQIETYRYNAVPLKFKSGRVAILGKSGYLAYEGEVDGGAANGEGILYAPDGDVVYRGAFVENQYSGEGKRYYDSNSLWYEGSFAENQFAGEGKLYRENGTLEYEGSFAAGLKDGHGILYDGSGSRIYEGSFHRDSIVYEELLGRTASELSAMYSGRKLVYTSASEYCVYLPEINAVYRAHSGENTLEGEWTADGIYVLKQSVDLEGNILDGIPQVSTAVGTPVYEGNTAVTLPDAVAINAIAGKEGIQNSGVRMETTQLLEDCMRVDAYDNSHLTYLYRFDTEKYVYTFFCTEKNGGFDFYLLEEKDIR